MSTKKPLSPTVSPATPENVVAALHAALDAVRELTGLRLEAKLSVSRLNGVARELKELLKVMSVYGI